ncbi:MAG: cbb3-type cytochrome c oxidase subunit I [Armatimonadetes bacterium]|nr:cbb3-type cytochrome c oxidase subunit I [Armatimonadota bacterium]
MPRWSRWMVRMSLVYLVLGLGLHLLTHLPLSFAWLANAAPSVFHLLVVGWATQMIFGVAYWMFPRLSRSAPYGSERASAVVFWCLNLGLVLRVVAEPTVPLSSAPIWEALLLTSAGFQWLASLVFVFTIWGRVREK